MNPPKGDPEDAEPDYESADTSFGRFTFFALGIAATVCLWAIVSFTVPIVDSRIPGLWPFPKPEGNTSWGELIVAGITLVYVWASLRQWRVSQGLLRITRASFEETSRANVLTLRAWLIVEDMGRNPFGRKVLTIHTRNVGKVPASDVSYTTYSHYFYDEEVPWPLPDDGAEQPQTSYSMAPGELHFMHNDIPLPDNIVADIQHGKAKYAVSAVITYTDVIDTKGETRLNAIYDRERGVFALGPHGNSIK